MGFSLGDERNGSTYIVHFAGTYGGATQEKGTIDPLAMLIVYKECVRRQMSFLSTLSYEAALKLGLPWEMRVNVHRQLAITKKYETMYLARNECISRVFSDFDSVRAETMAASCMYKINDRG